MAEGPQEEQPPSGARRCRRLPLLFRRFGPTLKSPRLGLRRCEEPLSLSKNSAGGAARAEEFGFLRSLLGPMYAKRRTQLILRAKQRRDREKKKTQRFEICPVFLGMYQRFYFDKKCDDVAFTGRFPLYLSLPPFPREDKKNSADNSRWRRRSRSTCGCPSRPCRGPGMTPADGPAG
ncbi:hypothetical protein SKAU_G00004360 [Synaphobranchus kaupii]|uniref:Uncharacterized protein n=1 Tax=Synaphobranchus kaupii TaxID=118154 RepID=A0A9Q1G9P8_SYNKA|nr:hypothetical protein SKAU_G00004360 [Synaphobranchus kaupii]